MVRGPGLCGIGGDVHGNWSLENVLARHRGREVSWELGWETKETGEEGKGVGVEG